MTLNSEQLAQGFMVGDRLVQPARNRIQGPQGEARLEPKVMAVLLCLAEHAGEVVSRNAIYDKVWGHTVVSDQALTNCISELRQHLGDDRAEPRYIETVPKRGYRLVAPLGAATPGENRVGRRLRTLPSVAAGLLLAALIAVIAWTQRGTASYEALPSVVSMPFENVNGDPAIDYLRLALPDEITTLLTQSPDLAVRPFEPGAPGNPPAAGRVRKAAYVVTGHYYLEADERLAIAFELLNVEHERLVWRAQMTVPADDVLALRQQIATRVRRGMLPALGASPEFATPQPSDADAYRLYLQSLAVSRDAGPNLKGIGMLEQTVNLDRHFASAWAALASRYHYDGIYGDGGAPALQRARDAATRALAEDPALADAAHELVTLQTEAGELSPAYRRARELVDRRGRSAYAHFALAFVLRYAGMLEGAERHCDIALALDPHNHDWRTCALAFLSDGKSDRAAEFIALDPGSYWSNLAGVLLRLREDDRPGALQYARALPADGPDRRFMVPCLEGRSGPALDQPAAEFVHRWRRLHDSEPAYHIGAVLAWCGRTRDALSMLRHAIERGFCAWPALDRDATWRPLRELPEFQRLREEAIACRERFRTAVGLAGAG
jgi:DNA-binding winged helix-turn-helix (wHTH) protein/TolB-like protein